MIRSIRGLEHVRLGFDAENLLTMKLSMTVKPEDAPRVEQFVDQLEARVGALPGVTAASISNGLPFTGASESSFYLDVAEPDNPEAEKMAVLYVTTPQYQSALGLRLLEGRFFADQDRADTAHVAVVDESFVEKYCEGKSPIGRRLASPMPDNPGQEIVGVVGHVKHYGVDGQVPVEPQVYLPMSQVPARAIPFVARELNLSVRTAGDPLALTSAIRGEVAALDANQPVFGVTTMEEAVGSSLANRRFAMMLLAVFAAVALLLSAVGIYGVMAYSVTQRTHEVGIRMALGARERDVLWMILRQGGRLAAIGIGIGVVAALALTRVMSSMLFSVSATDPATFTSVAAILVVVALLACLVPALRATRVDPMRALRHE
jgi:putative ABC transport system permease protein